MTLTLEGASSPELAAAVEANVAGFAVRCGLWPRCELHDEGDLLWSSAGLSHPLFNMVCRSRLPDASADARIDQTLEWFRSRNLPVLWVIGPSSRPRDLGGRLKARGLIHEAEMRGMAVDLASLNDDPVYPGTPAAPRDEVSRLPGLTIVRVADARGMSRHLRIGARVFEYPEFVEAAFLEMFLSLGLGAESPMRHFLGLLDGQPVATSTLFLGAGIAGIYNVATLPEARRQGIGAALTRTPLLAARREGYRVGTLISSDAGFPVYERLGFRECCLMGQYVWTPDEGMKDEG